jgi:hypothetical protein
VRAGQAAHPPGQAQGADTGVVAAADENKFYRLLVGPRKSGQRRAWRFER